MLTFMALRIGGDLLELVVHAVERARHFFGEVFGFESLHNFLDLRQGSRSLRAMASLRVTVLPITFRFAPQTRQYCVDCDSVPHWGQYISTSIRACAALVPSRTPQGLLGAEGQRRG